MKTILSSTLRLMTVAMVIVPTLTVAVIATDAMTSEAHAQQIGGDGGRRGRDDGGDNDGDESRRNPNYPCGTITAAAVDCVDKVEAEPCECRVVTRNGMSFRDCYITLTSGVVKYCNRPANSVN